MRGYSVLENIVIVIRPEKHVVRRIGREKAQITLRMSSQIRVLSVRSYNFITLICIYAKMSFYMYARHFH